ncbi:MAG: glycosyltransferase family 4 protein [Candidatus Dojkabacteria bacterium]
MKENKNIVVMAWRDIWHPEAGGAEVYITKMVETLRDNGYTVKYLTSRYKGSKKEEIRDGIEYIRMGNSISLYILAPLYYIFNLKKESNLLIENFNAVPFNIPLYNRNNITVIHHLQSPEWISAYGTFLGGIASFIFTKMTTLIYKREKNIVTVSPSSKKDLISNGFKEKNLTIIYNGIDVKVLNRVEKKNDPILIVSLGRIKATKHIEEAIEMIEYSKKQLNINNIILKIAGKGEDETRLKALVKEKGLDENVKFLGYISEQEKEDLLDKAHLHVQFSRKEGWGITVIEAAAKGTPTICYPVPGLIDSVSDKTGYFIQNSLKETWKEAIEGIQTNSEEYVSKQNNCIKWATNFEWSNQTRLFLDKVRSVTTKIGSTAELKNKNIK